MMYENKNDTQFQYASHKSRDKRTLQFVTYFFSDDFIRRLRGMVTPGVKLFTQIYTDDNVSYLKRLIFKLAQHSEKLL